MVGLTMHVLLLIVEQCCDGKECVLHTRAVPVFSASITTTMGRLADATSGAADGDMEVIKDFT